MIRVRDTDRALVRCAFAMLARPPAGTPLLGRTRARQAAGTLAAARVALGAVAFVAPTVPARPWVGSEEAARPGARLLARALGARDLALGLGALLAMRHEASLRGWVEAGGLADAGDTVATLVAFRSLPRRSRWAVLASTVGAAAGAAVLAPYVDRE
ncbi:MAG TPA: hypothetical protein VMV02_02315 [Acidimicrobiales bacterium]|nr:hypothetical protein [Acidimicrobiales bacterium]